MSKIYLLVSLLVSVLLLSSCGMTSNSSIVKSYKDGEIKQSEYYEQMYVNTLKSSSSSTKLDWLEYYEVLAIASLKYEQEKMSLIEFRSIKRSADKFKVRIEEKEDAKTRDFWRRLGNGLKSMGYGQPCC